MSGETERLIELAGELGRRVNGALRDVIPPEAQDHLFKAQKELLHAALKYRSRQNDVSDAIAALFDLPTRRDLDGITRQLTELRREVRALRREKEQSKGQS